ncbi:MAG: cytochrome c [Bacteroidota bacterium]|nr:cytochrome c [Bacteroidota bacterium]
MKYIFLLFSVVIFSQEKEKSIDRGKNLYEDLCLRCHSPDGNGVKGVYPPLAKSDFLFTHINESIIAVKQGGIEGKIVVNGVIYDSQMEDMGLYSDEVADVMNYILNSWGNNYDKMITKDYVEELINK